MKNIVILYHKNCFDGFGANRVSGKIILFLMSKLPINKIIFFLGIILGCFILANITSAQDIITITYPKNGEVISGSVTVIATVSDNVQVVGVRFIKDKMWTSGVIINSPYQTTWDTLLEANGTHILTAIVEDIAGNTASSSITVTVSNVSVGTDAVTVRAGQINSNLKLLPGFVDGFSQPYDAGTIGKIDQLYPQFWRISIGYYWSRIYDHVVTNAQFPQRLGTKITIIPSILFRRRYGEAPYRVSPSCPIEVTNCFASFNELKNAWSTAIDDFMQNEVVGKNLLIDYFDLHGEPNWEFDPVTITNNQKFELLKIAHDTVRSYKPAAKIVGPSTGSFDVDINFLKQFLIYVSQNNIRLDGISWHELGDDPDVVPSHVDMARQFLKTLPLIVPNPEIHINEYAGPTYHLVPGHAVGWIYYFEKAGINWASRACWWPETSLRLKIPWSDCYAGFDGVLLQDNATPQPVYWVQQIYAQMKGLRLLTESSHSKVIALASRNDVAQELRILLGKYNSPISDVRIDIQNYPYAASAVVAEVHLIPNEIYSALLNPVFVTSQILPVNNGTITILLNPVQNGESYSIVLTPPTIKPDTTPPSAPTGLVIQ